MARDIRVGRCQGCGAGINSFDPEIPGDARAAGESYHDDEAGAFLLCRKCGARNVVISIPDGLRITELRA